MDSEKNETAEAGKMTPQRAQQILQKHGTNVSLEEAVLILEFIGRLANIAVAQSLRSEAGRAFQDIPNK
jgi:hypothetical protein